MFVCCCVLLIVVIIVVAVCCCSFAAVINISVHVVLVACIAFSLTCSVDLSRYYLLVSASSAVLARRCCWHLLTSLPSHCPAVIFRDQRHSPAVV